MNLPPSQPPQSFHYTGNAHFKSLTSLIFFGGVLVVTLVNVVKIFGQGKSIPVLLLALCLFIDIPIILFSWSLFFNRWGGRIEIKDGTIKMLRRNNSNWKGCKFSSVVSLEYTMPKGETKPNMYFIKLSNGAIFFSPDVENLDLLISTIELRTSKKFQKV